MKSKTRELLVLLPADLVDAIDAHRGGMNPADFVCKSMRRLLLGEAITFPEWVAAQMRQRNRETAAERKLTKHQPTTRKGTHGRRTKKAN